MENLKNEEYSYANLVILQIRRMIDLTMIEHREYTDAEIVNIALDILRIMTEISCGTMYFDEGTERTWDLFFDAQKTEKGLLFLMADLYRHSKVKNQLINEILKSTKGEDLEKLIKELKG